MAFTPQPALAQPYPEGHAGIKMSVDAVARGMREARLDPQIRGWAIDTLTAAGIDGRNRPSIRQQAEALLGAFRKQTVYVPDASGAEWIQAGHVTLCLRDRCIRGGDCFPEGTLLLRDDYSLVQIEDLRVGDRIWGRDRWTRVQAVQRKGRLAVDAVEMNNGSTMYLTANHKVYVGKCVHGRTACSNSTCSGAGRSAGGYDRVAVSDLAEGVHLLQPERIDYGDGQLDVDTAYVEGLYVSEGWAEVESSRFAISGQDGSRKETLKHEVKAICEKRGISYYWHRKYIRIQDEGWTLRVAELGERARFKHVRTMALCKPSLEAQLRGVMSDSAANTNGPGRTFSTTSRTLMVQVRVMQRMCGVSTSVRMLTPEQHGGAGKHPLWRVGVRVAEKTLLVRGIERGVAKVPCWDIQTEDHYVYLPEHDVTVSNCDDLTLALGGAMLSVGLPAFAVKVTYGRDHQEHILVGLVDDKGNDIYADPSTNRGIQDNVPMAVEEQWVDPLDVTSTVTGTSGAEIVTLGKPQDGVSRREVYFKGGHWFEFRYGRWWLYAGGRWIDGGVDYVAKGLPGLGSALLFGWHTIAELQDLYNALTYQTQQITTAYNCASTQWQSANAAVYNSWVATYNLAIVGWNTQAAKAQTMITTASGVTGGEIDLMPAINSDGDDEFDVLAKAFKPFEELDRQMRAAGSGFPETCLPNYAGTPQPTNPDLDLATIQIADSAIQVVEKVVHKAGQATKNYIAPAAAIGAALGVMYILVRLEGRSPRR